MKTMSRVFDVPIGYSIACAMLALEANGGIQSVDLQQDSTALDSVSHVE